MTLWIILALLSSVALAFIVWPLYKSSGRLTPLLAVVIVLAVGVSAALYNKIGQPNVPSGGGSMPDSQEIVASLAERLENEPDDLDGWLMLGRSYQSMQQYDDAIAAFEKAVALEQGQNAQSLTALAIALLEQHGGGMTERAASLFENALALEPTNPNALFYGGGAAAWRGDTALAADRWEILMRQDAPPEIQDMLQRKINEWRGLPAEVELPTQVELPTDTIIAISLSLSDAARAELPADATVYVIARDPAQPSPPIAVSPRRLGELPVVVALSDRNAMVAGRLLSAFQEVEVVARVSLSGTPMAQSGDWFGSLITAPKDGATVNLVIDQRVP
jgi:cytochrome c-type biogenesis protein CcmH